MAAREIFFLPAGDGQRFCVYYPPKTPIERGVVLYIHPFAEEMNKSRRMAAQQSRAMAEAGYAVLRSTCSVAVTVAVILAMLPGVTGSPIS